MFDGNKEEPGSWNDSAADSDGESNTWTSSEARGETESAVLIPKIGKELSHVQFRSLEEQLFRAMAVLFDQQQRHGVARLVGMNAPVSLRTPEVLKMPSSSERIQNYLNRLYEKLPFVLSSSTAQKNLTDREKAFSQSLLGDAEPDFAAMKRKIR